MNHFVDVWKVAIGKPGREILPEPNQAGIPILDFKSIVKEILLSLLTAR
jgi:hypothetical protein